MQFLFDADGHLKGADIIANGGIGQMNYLSSWLQKALNSAVWEDHQAAGCKDAFTYEDSAADILNAGLMRQHALTARTQFDSCGIGQAVVHWACDTAVTPDQFPTIWANAQMASEISDTIPGLYGENDLLAFARENGCSYLFDSAGWNKSSVVLPSITVAQQLQQVTVSGLTCDVDLILASDYGQWPRPIPLVSAIGGKMIDVDKRTGGILSVNSLGQVYCRAMEGNTAVPKWCGGLDTIKQQVFPGWYVGGISSVDSSSTIAYVIQLNPETPGPAPMLYEFPYSGIDAASENTVRAEAESWVSQTYRPAA